MAEKQQDRDNKVAVNLAYNKHLIKILGLLELERGIDLKQIKEDCQLANVQFLYDITSGAKKFTGSFKNKLVEKYPFINKQYIDEGEQAGEPFIKTNGIIKESSQNQTPSPMITMPKEVWEELKTQMNFNREVTMGHLVVLKNFSIDPGKFLKGGMASNG